MTDSQWYYSIKVNRYLFRIDTSKSFDVESQRIHAGGTLEKDICSKKENTEVIQSLLLKRRDSTIDDKFQNQSSHPYPS